jgi:hypothetical protein
MEKKYKWSLIYDDSTYVIFFPPLYDDVKAIAFSRNCALNFELGCFPRVAAKQSDLCASLLNSVLSKAVK